MRIRIKRPGGQWQLHIDTKNRHTCIFWCGRIAVFSYSTKGALHLGGEL